MVRRVLLCLPAIGYGVVAGPAEGLDDAAVLLQGTWENLPAIKNKVEQALKQVDPAQVFGALGAFAKMTSQQASMQPQQWTLGGGTYGGYVHPMPQQLQPAAYGQPMFQQMQPNVYGQPMLYQQRAPMYSGMAPMQQYQWQMPQMPQMSQMSQMQTGPMAAPTNFMLTPMQQAAAQMQQAAQAAKDAAENAMLEGLARVKATSKRRLRDLAFVHVPGNYGHTIEHAALMPQGADGLSAGEGDAAKQEALVNLAQRGGEAWGMTVPELQQLSATTGCEMYYTPQKYWPEALAEKYFRYDETQNKTVFGMLRDPYDKLVNEFRMQALGSSALNPGESRKAISEREGSVEREKPEYLRLYESCDVSSWVKAELSKFKSGDRFRSNCHLLPQKEYFEGSHGIEVPIDNRFIPQSFNEVMKNHNYDIWMNPGNHNLKCEISAWSLDDEAKELIRDVYADDFALLCQHFGYCDSTEMTCLKQLPRMCGDAPQQAAE